MLNIKLIVISVLVLSSLITGYVVLEKKGKDDPISSLYGNQLSEQYNHSFWQGEEKHHSELWNKAVEVCAKEEVSYKPNCGAIHDIQFWAKPLPMKQYGSGEGFGSNSLPTLSH